MKYTYTSSHGRKEVAHGWKFKVGVFCVAVACLLVPMVASAGATITQGEFLGWVASATGDGPSLGSPTPQDLVVWAQGKGLSPNGGWNASAVLTKEILAQTLVQLFNLNPKKYGGDFEKNLLREGIVLPTAKNLTREDLINVMDQFGMQGKLCSVSNNQGTPIHGNNGHFGIPLPPGFMNPRNPHYGQVVPGTADDPRPGHVGLGHGAR
jgi:hypothetical protein